MCPTPNRTREAEKCFAAARAAVDRQVEQRSATKWLAGHGFEIFTYGSIMLFVFVSSSRTVAESRVVLYS